MKLISVEDLEKGMVLAEPVYGNFDLLYASEGEELTPEKIYGLQRLGLDYVYVMEEHDLMSDVTAKAAILKSAMMDYSDVIDMMGDVFQDYDEIKASFFERMEEPVTRLINAVAAEPALLMHIKRQSYKDTYTYQHCIRVALLSSIIGRWMRFDSFRIQKLAWAGLLHDIGKSMIPAAILNKPGKLDIQEFDAIKLHSEHGYHISKKFNFLGDDVLRGIKEHHERVNGSGYPAGLVGDEIHIFARIISVADTFDALTSHKVYNDKVCAFKAVEEINSSRFSQELDPMIVDVFQKNVYRLFVGSMVELDKGIEGELIYFNIFDPKRPLIRVDDEFVDLSTDSRYKIESIK